MTETDTPRAMIRAIAQGFGVPRPLLLPIAFSLGARLENLPLRAYLCNPTKIANALRQIRGVLGLDGVVCYYDPYLEAEALGCPVSWSADGSSCTLDVARGARPIVLGAGRALDEIARRGRIPMACEVVRRLKVMLPGEPALAAVVTAPYALARQVMGDPSLDAAVSDDVLAFAADVMAVLCRGYLDAGANVIFLREDVGAISDYQRWAGLIDPVVNVIRFYEALPVLMQTSPLPDSVLYAVGGVCGGLICPGAIDLASGALSSLVAASRAAYLPLQQLAGRDASYGGLLTFLRTLPPDMGLSLLTTQEDMAANSDIRQLASLFKNLQGWPRAIA